MATSVALPVLYKQPEAWSLPSSSVASIQVEAYLRFTGLPFHVEVCSSASKSPTGQIPALEKEGEVAGLEDGALPVPSAKGVLSEFASARACTHFAARHVKDIDAHLSSAQRAELLAYTVLVETRLDTATVVSAWCEPSGFAEMRKVSGQLPFPLNHIIPWSTAREVRARHGHLDADDLYTQAVGALLALSDRLASSPGPFFFGASPCSLDALLAGHLMYYRLSKAAPPVLHDKVAASPKLSAFVELVARDYFAVPVSAPPPRSLDDDASWSDAAKGHTKSKAQTAELTDSERQFRRNSRLWLLGCGVALVAYCVMSGQYIKLDFRPQEMFGDDDGDEEEDEGDDE
ncbi:hypothetical protein FOA52_002827 [Chlamydomonas sp. UWO 241]|nr:hypothetical protein FOA52_002827 [Chlamydomonas sp. UWO 241]